MTGRREEIVTRLEADAAATADFFKGLTAAQLAAQVYHEGASWTARQVLAHLVTIEQSMQRLFSDMLAGIPDSSRGFDIERFNRSQPRKLDGLGLDELIARFREVRARTVAKIASMSDEDLDREGWHPFHGAGRLERFLRWAYEHAQLHVDDVRRALEAAVV